MVLANRSSRPISPQRPRASTLDQWVTGVEVGLFVLISGGAGVALLWFVAQGEASPYGYWQPANPSPAPISPAPATSCVDRSVRTTATATTCLRVN